MTEWVDTVQSYDKDGYSYLEDLKRFVNGGMTYDTFIMNASKILQHGCHGDYTRCHAADGAWERMDNFKMITKLFRLEVREEELATASSSSSTSSFSRPTPPTRPARTRPPTVHPTPRPSSIVIVTPPPSPAPSPRPTVEPGSPTAKPTPRMPWYVNYDLRTCVNDGKQADWVDQSRLYGSKEVCCRKYFDYSEYKSDYLACISGGSASDSGRSESGDAQLNDQEPKEEAGVTLQVIGCPPSGWYSTPDCKSFFMCKNGRQFGEVMRCGEGLLFDKKSSSCLPDHIVKCDSLTSQSKPPPTQLKPPTTPPPVQFGSHEHHSKTRPNT